MKIGHWLVYVVRVDLNDPRIRVIPLVAPHKKASFADLIARFHPAAAINGTFFDTRTWRITGNLVRHGRLLDEGYVGNTMAFDAHNHATLLCDSGKMGRHIDWAPYRSAIEAGPTLLVNGQQRLDPRAEGFHDRGLFRRTRRSVLASTKNGKLLLITTLSGVTFHELARIVRHLGGSNAMCLDGGSSSALYCGGRVLLKPNRCLTNLLGIYIRTAQLRPGYRKYITPACPAFPATGPSAVRDVLPPPTVAVPESTKSQPALKQRVPPASVPSEAGDFALRRWNIPRPPVAI